MQSQADDNQTSSYKIENFHEASESFEESKRDTIEEEEETKGDDSLPEGAHSALSAIPTKPKKQKTKPTSLENILLKSQKVYESDKENYHQRARSSSSDGGYFNPSDDFLSGDDSGSDDDANKQQTMQQKAGVCSCFGLLLTKQIIAKTKSEMQLAKPQGLFGQLSYKEVCKQIGEKSSYCGL